MSTGENRFAKRQLPVPLAVWRAAVGPRIADRARPIALERGVLVIKATTSVWANELSMLAPKILEKLAESLPDLAVKSLRFRVGPLDVIEGIQEKRTYRRIPPPAPLGTELESSLAKVEDDELRTLIASAASRNLAWQQKPPIAAPRGAPSPPGAETRSAPPGRSEEGSGGAWRRSSEGGACRPP